MGHTGSMNTKKIIKKSYEQLYGHKFDNLDEMDPFLERNTLPKFTKKAINNLNTPILWKKLCK